MERMKTQPIDSDKSSSMHENIVPKKKGPKKGKSYVCRRQWVKFEDDVLVECMLILKDNPLFRTERGFKCGYVVELEKMMAERIPNCTLKAQPHIDSRVKILKRQYFAINEMIEKGSGFGWDDEEKCITCTQDVFDEWVRSHPNAKGLRHKPWKHYDAFVAIYGKDRANGAGAETAADAMEELENDIAENNDEEMAVDVDVDGHTSTPVRDDGAASACPIAVGSESRAEGSGKKSRKEFVNEKQWEAALVTIEQALDGTRAHLEGIANFFKKETMEKERKGQVYSVISKLDGVIITEMLTATVEICKEPHKIDILFGLPMEVQKEFVRMQLGARQMEGNKHQPNVTTKTTKNQEECKESQTMCKGSHVAGVTSNSVDEDADESPIVLTNNKMIGANNGRRASKRLANRRRGGLLSSSMFDCHMGKLWKSFKRDNIKNMTWLDSMWFFMYTEEIYKDKVLNWIMKKNILLRKYVFIPIVLWGH